MRTSRERTALGKAGRRGSAGSSKNDWAGHGHGHECGGEEEQFSRRSGPGVKPILFSLPSVRAMALLIAPLARAPEWLNLETGAREPGEAWQLWPILPPISWLIPGSAAGVCSEVTVS